jgi:hypothetical protein
VPLLRHKSPEQLGDGCHHGQCPHFRQHSQLQLGPGEFEIEVEAAGYNKGTEHGAISTNRLRQTLYVYLTPLGSSTVAAPASGVVVTPSVQFIRHRFNALAKAILSFFRNSNCSCRSEWGSQGETLPYR